MAKMTDTPYKCEIGVRPNRKYATKEEAYEAHKARVREWQKNNKDKTSAYQAKYGKKPERMAAVRENYANMDPEKKEHILARQREYFKKNYYSETGKNYYKQNKEEILAKGRAKYAAMSPDEREALLAKRRAHYQAKKLEKLNDPKL